MTTSPPATTSPERGASLAEAIAAIVAQEPAATWSICVRDDDGTVVAAHRPERVLPTASVGKVLLLAEVARRIEADPDEASRLLDRRATVDVGEAGLWQRLRIDTLAIADVACLVATVSDNLATNVLLDHVGLPAVDALTTSLGLQAARLLDRIRPVRTAAHPPHPSEGNAAEWSDVFARIDRGRLHSPGVSSTLRAWLFGNADLSMIAAPFGFDPLAHPETEARSLYNKTGSDPGTRADVGRVVLDGAGVAYAALVRWPVDDRRLQDRVLGQMQSLGGAIRRYLETGEKSFRSMRGDRRCGSTT